MLFYVVQIIAGLLADALDTFHKDLFYAVAGAVGVTVTTLTGAIGVLWGCYYKMSQKVQKQLLICEKERLELWKAFYRLSSSASSCAEYCPLNSHKQIKEIRKRAIAELDNDTITELDSEIQ